MKTRENDTSFNVDMERFDEAKKELCILISQGKDKGIDLVDWYDKWRVYFGDSGVQDIMNVCFEEQKQYE